MSVLLLAVDAGLAGAHTLRLSRDAAGQKPASTFGCAEPVYVHIDWDPRPHKGEVVRAAWRNTGTGVSHVSTVVTEEGTPASWLWVSFDPASGMFSRLTAPEGAYQEFIGAWTVDVTVDGRPLAQERFTVQC